MHDAMDWGVPEVAFDEARHLPAARAEPLVALAEALDRLGRQEARMSRIVECCYFGGLTRQETAESLSLSLRTLERHWRKARRWLYRELHDAAPASHTP